MGRIVCECIICAGIFFVGVCIFSFLNVIIRGGAKRGSRDILIELLGGVAALFCFFSFGVEDYGAALTVFGFYCVLTVVAFRDIDRREIADGCHLAVLVLAGIAVFTMPGVGIMERLTGAVCVSAPMLLLAVLRPGALGGGDIKLMAVCGLFLGRKATLVSMAIAILSGGIYGIWLLAARKANRKTQFAFGPFLCIGMAAGAAYGERLGNWYLTAAF